MWLCLPDVWLLPFLKGHKYMWYKNISNDTQINFEYHQVIYITGMLWWHVVHDNQNTVPMMTTVLLTMTTKTLCQWCPLCQCRPGPPEHCANDDHCTSVDHDHQTLCQWCPLCQCCPWPLKHCANDVHYASVDQEQWYKALMFSVVLACTSS